MRLRRWLIASALIVSVTALPSPAHADIVLSPFAGVNFGGDATEKPMTFGGNVTFVGRSLGLEIDAARSNDFFGEDSASVTMLSASLVGGADLPGTGVKPYFLAGAGLLRTNVEFANILNETSYNNFAVVLGGGLNAYITDHVGLRGDLRYVRRLEKDSDAGIIPIESNFDFWRATVGVNIRFF
jgi:opacity protein-like surface antigen